MRSSLYLLVALLASSCANYQTCPPSAGAPRTRLAVISDIDDTIKDTHVKIGQTHLTNPGILLDPLRPWHRVEGMQHFFRAKGWSPAHGVTVIYVSAGPCSYRRRLKESISGWQFPKGEIVLRERAPFPPAPHDYKTRAIDPIIRKARACHFILVGDSGERDPECYGELARRFPHRVDAIYIRKISGDEPSRYARVFCEIDPRKIHFIAPDLARRTGPAEKPKKSARRYDS